MSEPQSASTPATRVLLGLALTLLVALHAVQIARSMDWPIVGDAALMHYIAWRLEAGAVPYRDAYDMNFPGTLAMHLGARRLLGPSDLGWRCFDLGGLAAAALLLYSIGRTSGSGRLIAGAAALAFSVYHVAGGPGRVGQRDFFALVLMLAATRASIWGRARPGAAIPMATLAGLAAGTAVSVKPVCALFVVILAGWWLLALGRDRRAVALVSFTAAAAAVPLALLVWLYASGALAPFADILGNYLLPYYRALGSTRPLRTKLLLVTLAAGALLSVVTALLARRAGALTADRVLLLLGVGYGLFHYFYQGKGWVYHLYPLAGFSAAVLASLGDQMFTTTRGRARAHAAWVAIIAATVVYASVRGFATLSLSPRGFGPSPTQARKLARVDAIAADLAPLLNPSDTVQVFDTSRGGVQALLRLGVVQPTRFIYDFHFYHDTDEPYIRALRGELMAGLEAAPPRALVLMQYVFPSGAGYERLDWFPELNAWLEHGYRLGASGNQYRIYERVDAEGGT